MGSKRQLSPIHMTQHVVRGKKGEADMACASMLALHSGRTATKAEDKQERKDRSPRSFRRRTASTGARTNSEFKKYKQRFPFASSTHRVRAPRDARARGGLSASFNQFSHSLYVHVHLIKFRCLTKQWKRSGKHCSMQQAPQVSQPKSS